MEALPPTRGAGRVPSLVRNPRWLKPFEVLVNTYGVTGYDEINPTLIAAAAFTFMFGLMFGDLGHGAILAAVAGLMLWRGISAGAVLLAAGAASMVFGALYGVAFGAEVFHALWLQPLHAIFELLIAAVVAGIVILNLGMVLNLISARRAGDRMRFWLDKSGVLGLAFYWTLVGGGLAVFQGWIPAGVWLLVALPLAAATMFREPIEETLQGQRASWTGNLVGGFFELFETVIGYLSNSLSFVRMGAFAVAHEGLSQMVLSYSSGATGWLVFLFGTLLIVGFEGLIVGIQSLRLSYYEFFGRFFEGRGTRFRPLAFAGGSDV
jgi:V/A-type H+-transporting ATPase subunit I